MTFGVLVAAVVKIGDPVLQGSACFTDLQHWYSQLISGNGLDWGKDLA